MPQISSNFILRAKVPNFERDSFETLDSMLYVNPAWMDDGHISYCKQDRNHYVYRSTNDEGIELFGPDRWTLLVTDELLDELAKKSQRDFVLVVNTKEELLDEYATNNPVGKLAYVTDTQTYFYNTYDNTIDTDRESQPSIYLEDSTGWWYPLIPDKYITKEDAYTKSEIDNIISGVSEEKPDGDPFIRESELDELLPTIEGGISEEKVDEKLKVYATKNDLNEVSNTTTTNKNAIAEVSDKLDVHVKLADDRYASILDDIEKANGLAISAAAGVQSNVNELSNRVSQMGNEINDKIDSATNELSNRVSQIENDINGYENESGEYQSGIKDIIKKHNLDLYGDGEDAKGVIQDLEDYKKEVEETYAKPDDISRLLNTYAPSIDNKDKWVANPIAGNLAGKTGEEIGSEHYSYNAVLDQILFGDFIPTITNPSVQVSLKDDWNGEIAIDWYDEKNRIILVKAGSAGPDGADFYATNITDAIINYPEGLDLSSKYTNGLTTSDEQQISVGFCRIKDENGNWDYYKQEGNIYHVPSILEEGEYRYYMAAYFQKGSPALSNTNLTISEWDETQVVESKDYITIITSKPMYYNTPNGMVEKDLVMWGDEVVDYAELLPTCKLEQSFSIPRKIKSLSIWNDVAGDFAIVPLVYAKDDQGAATNNLVPAYFNEVVEENGYYTYKYDSEVHGHRGAIKIKVVF